MFPLGFAVKSKAGRTLKLSSVQAKVYQKKTYSINLLSSGSFLEQTSFCIFYSNHLILLYFGSILPRFWASSRKFRGDARFGLKNTLVARTSFFIEELLPYLLALPPKLFVHTFITLKKYSKCFKRHKFQKYSYITIVINVLKILFSFQTDVKLNNTPVCVSISNDRPPFKPTT